MHIIKNSITFATKNDNVYKRYRTMTKEEAIHIIKRKIKEHEDAAKEEHYGKLTQTAISNYEMGRAKGLADALAIIGMIK